MTISNDFDKAREKEIERNTKIEKLANVQHEIWAHWMKYMFSQCEEEKEEDMFGKDYPTGGLIIPKEKVERWKRQIETSYSKLTEKEKESDRNQVRKFIHLI